MKILQITCCTSQDDDQLILGLGSDGQVYAWSWEAGEWFLHKRNF